MDRDKRKYDVQYIKKFVESVLYGNRYCLGDFLAYDRLKDAKNIFEKLKDEGVNCHIEKTDKRREYKIFFDDITKKKNKLEDIYG